MTVEEMTARAQTLLLSAEYRRLRLIRMGFQINPVLDAALANGWANLAATSLQVDLAAILTKLDEVSAKLDTLSATDSKLGTVVTKLGNVEAKLTTVNTKLAGGLPSALSSDKLKVTGLL